MSRLKNIGQVNVSSDLEDESSNKRYHLFTNRRPAVEDFSVHFQESYIESDLEKTNDNFKLPNKLFAKRRTSADNSINKFQLDPCVSFSQGNQEPNDNELVDSLVSPVVEKLNPFRKQGATQTNTFSVNYEETKLNLSDITTSGRRSLFKTTKQNSDKFVVSYSETNSQQLRKKTLSQETDDSSFNITKKNPFKLPLQKSFRDVFNVEFEESTYDNELDENFDIMSVFKRNNKNDNFDVTYNPTTQFKNTLTFEDVRNSVNISNVENITEESNKKVLEAQTNIGNELQEITRQEKMEAQKFLKPDVAVAEITTLDKHSPLEKNSNQNLDTDGYMDESSFNDDNLKCWMSDHTDDEVCLPSVAPVTSNVLSVSTKMSASNASIGNNSSQNKLNQKSHTTAELNISRNNELINSTSVRTSSTKNILCGNTTLQNNRNSSVRNTSIQNKNSPLSWEQQFQQIVANANRVIVEEVETQKAKKIIQKPQKLVNEKENPSGTTAQVKSAPTRVRKPMRFVTKSLYQYISHKLQPKYGLDTVIKTEELILSICEAVKLVLRRKHHQKKLIQDLKKEMAKAGIVETTIDFYEFVIKFLPHAFRIKVIPCLQPITNTIYPPKEASNPFDNIL
ncbi:hypothetical protein RUM44_010297 [Polyplax serrata]|uniref:Uncharacterized protein n=1 Tax=Polyplax serrata TaxID=468196 RepID=A0ABR1AWN0_POLSC